MGEAAANRVPVDRAAEIKALYRTHYAGFTPRHFHEHLVRHHNFTRGDTWTKVFLQTLGLLDAAPRRGAHRRNRPRRPLPGMMLHQDASRHVWVVGQPAGDLAVTLDDATSTIYSAILVSEEGTVSTFAGLLEVFTAHGLPCSLYADRGSHYFHTPVVGGKVSRTVMTQVSRALAQLGVEHIAAYSPEARGRSERAFRTLQKRLRKELVLAGSRRWRRGTDTCGRHTWRSTSRGSRSRPSSPARRSCRCRAQTWPRRCATRRSASSATTTRWRWPMSACRSRPVRCARVWTRHGLRATVKVRRYQDGSHAILVGSALHRPL
jgi:hypothetical protein